MADDPHQPSDEPHPSSDTYDPSQRDGSSGEALREAFRQFSQWQDYFRYYIATRIDSVKGSIRRIVLYAALGILALLVAATIVITAAVLLLAGIAGAINRMFHAEPWVGQLIVGVIVLAALGASAWIGMSWLDRVWKKKTQARYEAFKREQRLRWGNDVDGVTEPTNAEKP